jgi:hypothetical protein
MRWLVRGLIVPNRTHLAFWPVIGTHACSPRRNQARRNSGGSRRMVLSSPNPRLPLPRARSCPCYFPKYLSTAWVRERTGILALADVSIEVHENGDSFPGRALYTGRPLDRDGDQGQAVVLLFVEKVQDLGEEEICRYLVYRDSWDWGYAPSRIQLKAIARIMDRIFSQPVPLYHTKPSVLEKVRLGELVPRAFIEGTPLTNPSLEDYALSPRESRHAKECEELPAVLDYIKHHDLQSVVGGGN